MGVQLLAALVVAAVVVMALPRPSRAVVRTLPSTRKHRQENR